MGKYFNTIYSLLGGGHSKLLAVSTLLLVLFFALPIGAQEQSFEVAAWRFPPYTYVDASGEIKGHAVETVKKVLVAMGYRPKMILMPFKRCLKNMQEGSIPIMLPCAFSHERSMYMQYSNPIYHITTVLWKKSRNISDCWRNYSDLVGFRIGIGLGYSYGKQWDEAVSAYRLNLNPTPGNSPELTHFRMLAQNRIDLFISDLEVGRSIKTQNAPHFDNIYPCPKKIGEDRPFGATISRKYFEEHGLSPEEFLNRFNSILEEITYP